jgi:hypothetical protein
MSQGKRTDKLKPILVFVNPTSGTKIAKSMLQKILRPELEKRGIQFELVSFNAWLKVHLHVRFQ